MADKRTNAEIRADIEKEDRLKDVHIHLGVTIATISGISAAGGVLATLSIGFMEYWRKDVENLWMCCLPFVFPFITGVSVAYRKQLSNVGLHLALLAACMMAGGAGYGLSVEPVYLERANCTQVSEDRGPCEKETLVMIYVIAGGVAAGAAVLGFLVSLCACSKGQKNRARRVHEETMEAQAEADRRNRAVKALKNAPRASVAPVAAHPPTGTPAGKTNGTAANGGSQHDATTHL